MSQRQSKQSSLKMFNLCEQSPDSGTTLKPRAIALTSSHSVGLFVLVCVLTWSAVLLPSSTFLLPTDGIDDVAPEDIFANAQCNGTFDEKILKEVDRYCIDCYYLFKSVPGILDDCRANCFSTLFYHGCIEVLQFSSERKAIMKKVSKLRD